MTSPWSTWQASRCDGHERQWRRAHAGHARLALAVETGGDVEEAVQAAYMADIEPYEIAELSGLPMRRLPEIPG